MWMHMSSIVIYGARQFDENIVELYHVSKLLSVGGVLIIHDQWLPSVRKVRADDVSLTIRWPCPNVAWRSSM